MFDSFEAHKRVADDIANAYSEGYEQGKRDAQQWIPCSERLPEDKQRVVIQMHNGHMEIIDFSAVGLTDHILAWMPLPEPYSGADMKGEQE